MTLTVEGHLLQARGPGTSTASNPGRLSWLYLVLFALIGMTTVLLARRRSLALLSALGVWLVVTFAVPQVTPGLRPTSSLNPVVDPVSTSQTFFDITAHARPVSVSEQYKALSAEILDVGADDSAAHAAGRVFLIAAVGLALVLLIVRLVRTHDYSVGAADEQTTGSSAIARNDLTP